MDERMSRGVVETFVRLHKQGLIYRGKRLVNWDPKLLTAVSDLEVVSEETDGHMWHILYPFVDGPQTITDKDGQSVTLRGLTIATTRPETMLADGALCVHPEDPRYKHLVGKLVELPLCDRNIPIIADDFVDPEFGTGCVKITGAHDFNDYACALRHDLPMIVIFTLDAHINENGPKQFQGMERYEARKAVVAQLEAEQFLVKVEPHKMMQPKGDRTGVVLEPMLTDQWFVAMSKPAPEGTLNPGKSITQVALEVVADGRIQFYPDNWTTIYNQWLNNIQDWCISRQLWWGHQIPAWYSEDGQVFVAHNEAEAIEQARAAGVTGALTRDPDVLDTWFSSGLVPFTTLGWPENTPDLQRYLPSSVLVTGFDIIFFCRPHGHADHAHDRPDPVQARLRARPDPRRGRPEDEQIQGQHAGPRGPDRRHRPGWAGGQAHLRPDEPQAGRLHREGHAPPVPGRHPRLRHRRAALHHGRLCHAGPQHQLRPEALRGLP